MKKYLFGLGAMLVGAGLMFVLMYGEVSAEDETKVCERIRSWNKGEIPQYFDYCKIRDLTCVTIDEGISCVKTKGGIFK